MKKQKKTKKGFNEKVHYSIAGRKRFKLRMWLITIALILIVCGCAVMVMFGGWKWDPDEGFSPSEDPKKPYQYALIWVGAILALATIVGYVLICIKQFKGFYATQAEYFKSKDFKEKKQKVLDKDLSKEKKSTLKWYKKLGYITATQVREAIAKQKADKKAKQIKEIKNKK